MGHQLKVFNAAALAELVQLEQLGEAGLVKDLILGYLENSCPLVEKLQGFYDCGDLPSFESAAHALKSSSSLLGLEKIARVAADLEATALAGRMSADPLPELRGQMAAAVNELKVYLQAR